MKKKSVLVIFLSLIILISIAFIFAAEDDAIVKAYTCLSNQLKDNCGGTINTEQISLNLLAVSYDSKLQSDCSTVLKNKKKTNCWADTDSGPCTLKSTSLATISLKNINENVDDSIEWILSKKEVKTGLTWFLEVDTDNQTECDINGKKIIINENKKISGTDPVGLVKAYNNYWFQITNLNRNFTVSCDKDFITTLLYQKPGSSVIHVSSQTHSTPAGDSITEAINSFCFATSSSCDFEGSLWATLALAKQGEDVSSYMPYLSAMAEDGVYTKYLPYAFLYMLSNEDDYYSQLVQQQVSGKEGKYWEQSNRRLYDTALGSLAIQSSNSQELDDAKTYLLSVQEKSGDMTGCWNDNTAFILYALWPREATKSTSSSTSTDCESFGHYCVPSLQCTSDNHLVNFDCLGLNGDVCCNTQATQLESCSQKNGLMCKQDEKCSGNEVPASDTNFCCANGGCEAIEKTNECLDLTYSCKTSCADTEEEKISYSSSCDIGQKCCAKKQTSGTNWLLIILLGILILLVILAIIFRNQLRIWIFRTKSGFGYGKPSGPGSRPPVQPSGFRPIFPPRPAPTHMYPRQPQQQVRRPAGRPEKDREFEDTMKKLREISK